jgi:hypothetical protein
MKYVLIVALVLSQITLALAQYPGDNGNPITEEDAPRVTIIKLDAGIPVHQFAMPVRNIEVIAIADDSTTLGISRNRHNEVTSTLAPDKPLQEYLQGYISKNYGDQYQQDKGKYLLCLVQVFRINDHRSFPERSYVRIKGASFLSADNVQFQLATQFDTTLVDAEKHPNRDHSRNMARAIDFFLSAADKQNVTGAEHTRQEIEKIAWERYKQPIYTSEHYTDGVYMSYKEFLKNAPTVTNFTIAIEKNKALVYHIHDDSSKNVIPAPWGICYKGQLFRCKWNSFILVKRHGLSFDVLDKDEQNTVYLKVTGGQIVDAVATALFTGDYLGLIPMMGKTDGHSSYLVTYQQDMLDRPYAGMIDPFTGELMF